MNLFSLSLPQVQAAVLVFIRIGAILITAPLFGSRAHRKILGYKAGLLSFAILANTSDGLGASLDIRTVK